MRTKCLLGSLILILFACSNNRKEVLDAVKASGLSQEKEFNGFALHLQYMPSKDQELLHFRLNIRSSDGTPLKNTGNDRFSYGLDSLFALINVTDTLPPVDVVRVANGDINGVEYMLLFDRPAVYSQVNCHLLFRDWLFTNRLMTFPIQGSAIAHIDSLSQKI